MKYFNRLLTLLCITCLLNCSEDNNQQNPIVNSLSSTNTYIGDTLTVTGTNLNQIGNISLYNEDIDEIFSDQANIISKTETEIKFIVPELFHEKVTVYFGSNIDPIDLELYGYIPYKFEFNGTIFRNAEVTQILNDNIVFCYHDNWNQRFKLTDNYGNLETLPSGNSNSESYYYITENTGYILTSDFFNFQIYSFNGDINNRNFEYNISKADLNTSTNSNLRDIKFISDNLAYVMNDDGEMFQVLNGAVTSFQNLYPGLSSTPYMSQEYMDFTSDFQVLEDSSILITPWAQNYILRVGNGEVNVLTFSANLTNGNNYSNTRTKPTFINSQGGFYLKGEHKIYKSNDYGQTWTANDINFPNDDNIVIEYLGGNQFILHRYLINPSNIGLKSKYISTDNGNSWRRIFYSSREGYGGKIDMYDEYGMTGSSTYGLVKFRKFPDDF
jgi:hypothetical protein